MRCGPSQFETGDPKPSAPSGIRTVGGTVPTRIPGVHFGSSLARLAQHADKLAIVRSFRIGSVEHDQLSPLVSVATHKGSIGAYYNKIGGLHDLTSGLPRAVSLFPPVR